MIRPSAAPAGPPAAPASPPPVSLPLPPGPRGHWALGTWPEWRRDSLGWMQEMVARYGDAVRFRYVPGFHGYLFTHPDHLRRILQDNHRNYLKQHPSYHVLLPLIGRGLLTRDRDEWLAHRRLMQPAFHRERIARLGAVMTEVASRAVRRWAPLAASGTPIDVDHEMSRVTLETVGRALFGQQLGGLGEEALAAYSAANEITASLTVSPLGRFAARTTILPVSRRLRAAIARLDSVVATIIAQRRATPEPGDDVLGMLLAARDEESGRGLTAQELRDEIMTLLLAGHDTTAQALTWTLYLVSRHPAVEARLRGELQQVLGGRPATADDLRALPYTRMVLHEAMRLYPPVYAFPRRAEREDVVGRFRIEPRATILLSPYLTHRHPEFWPDPERFDPERFTAEAIATRDRFAYIPFSAGARMCIGNAFALTEAQLMLAAFLRAYRFEPVPGYVARAEPRITLRPRGGMPMRLTPVFPARREELVAADGRGQAAAP